MTAFYDLRKLALPRLADKDNPLDEMVPGALLDGALMRGFLQ